MQITSKIKAGTCHKLFQKNSYNIYVSVYYVSIMYVFY